MAAVAKSGTPSPCSLNPCQHHLPSYPCGGDIAAGDVVGIDNTGNAFPATPGMTRVGFAATAANAGDAVTPTIGLRYYYGTALTPATILYLSATVAGGLDTTKPAGDVPMAVVIDSTRIQTANDLN